MSDEVKAEWVALGERLLSASPEKFDEILGGMRELVEAVEIIARFDWQLLYRGRPRKKYAA